MSSPPAGGDPLDTRDGAVRVAILDDYQIVVAGVAAMLEPFRARVDVVELDSRVPTVSEVDIVLYDTFGQEQGTHLDVADVTRGGPAKVVVYSWNVQRELVDGAVVAGASGYLWKGMSAAAMVDALEAVSRGELVLPPAGTHGSAETGSWPGQRLGLTARESEVLALITQGLSNREIADRVYLSVNSIKTYIRTAYRKIGVTRRSQAVLWGLQHGFAPDRTRVVAERGPVGRD